MIKNKLLTFIILIAFLFCFVLAINAVCAHNVKNYICITENSVQHDVQCYSCGIKLPSESHSFSYETNATSHTLKCKYCYFVKSSASHSAPSDWNYKDSSNHYKKCLTCGYTFSQVGHTFSPYTYDATSHYLTCSTCGYVKSSSHSYYYAYDNYAHTKKCLLCNYTGDVAVHNWPSNWNFTTITNHYKKCVTCEYTLLWAPHSIDISQDICTICGRKGPF